MTMRALTTSIALTLSLGCAEARADYAAFCEPFEVYTCERDYQSGRLSADGYRSCAVSVEARCTGTSFEPCVAVPSRSEADACIASLRDPARQDLQATELAECSFLNCGGI